MSRLTSVFLAALIAAGATGAAAQDKFPGVGRTATPAEIKAWDIDVRPDFKGLPRGSGSVKKGEDLWEAKCATCHGTFGESNSVFTAISGGTTSADIQSGRTASLLKPEQARTTLMKLSQVSTLWDYVNRAMPWNAPKTLSADEVYALVAYILNLGEIVPEDFVLSDANIAEVQKRLPNRNGMTRAHGLWDVKGKPDVKSSACMKDCAATVAVTSQLPDYARTAHGNLAEQNRTIGEVRGTRTVPAGATANAAPAQGTARTLAEKSGCLACHGIANKVVGPGLRDIAAKYKGNAGAEASLAAKVKAGGGGVWGEIPMPPNAHIQDDDIRTLVRWVLDGAAQ
ncbi:MAG: c-type cytochrome [Proteobacteria bacterium]|nr:c-type cytochrome [Pseudomonadota bacterium]